MPGRGRSPLMPSTLRKLPGRPPERGMYEISGSLDGVGPGRRVVKELYVNRLDGRGTEGLAPLVAFDDLRRLILNQVRDLDLEVLSRLDLEFVRIEEANRVNLGTFAARDGLGRLDLLCLDADCVVPREMTLPPSLWSLVLGEFRSPATGDQIHALLEAIDWSKLTALTSLYVRLENIPPVETDLTFLRHLPDLESLWITGVHHRGPAPSPLEPPFNGLSRKLQRVIIEADDPVTVREALRRHAGPELEPSVQQRRPYTPPPPPWEIHEPARVGGMWSAYGSLADAAGLSRDETESTGLRRARTRLREADPALLRRLDFDSESEGTSIMASARKDIVAALRILGLGKP
jgi:hypothetical protein